MKRNLSLLKKTKKLRMNNKSTKKKSTNRKSTKKKSKARNKVSKSISKKVQLGGAKTKYDFSSDRELNRDDEMRKAASEINGDNGISKINQLYYIMLMTIYYKVLNSDYIGAVEFANQYSHLIQNDKFKLDRKTKANPELKAGDRVEYNLCGPRRGGWCREREYKPAWRAAEVKKINEDDTVDLLVQLHWPNRSGLKKELYTRENRDHIRIVSHQDIEGFDEIVKDARESGAQYQSMEDGRCLDLTGSEITILDKCPKEIEGIQEIIAAARAAGEKYIATKDGRCIDLTGPTPVVHDEDCIEFNPSPVSEPPFRVGEKVRYRSQTAGRWIDAKVEKINDDGTIDLNVRKKANPSNMKRPSRPREGTVPRLAVGRKVEWNSCWEPGSRCMPHWRQARVTKINEDDTVDIACVGDKYHPRGEIHKNIPVYAIRPVQEPPPRPLFGKMGMEGRDRESERERQREIESERHLAPGGRQTDPSTRRSEGRMRGEYSLTPREAERRRVAKLDPETDPARVGLGPTWRRMEPERERKFLEERRRAAGHPTPSTSAGREARDPSRNPRGPSDALHLGSRPLSESEAAEIREDLKRVRQREPGTSGRARLGPSPGTSERALAHARAAAGRWVEGGRWS